LLRNNSNLLHNNTDTTKSKRFLDAFEIIRHHLIKITKKDSSAGFNNLLCESSRISIPVKRYKTDLKEYADLRNAIIHESPDKHVIAEPHIDAVEDIEKIASNITMPPKVIPLFKRNVIILKPSDSVAEAAKVMLNCSFSQIPIYAGERFIDLLTTNTIARWLGSCVKEDIFSSKETTVEIVLDYSEYKDKDNCKFLSKNSDIFIALDYFQNNERKARLDAIIITENGKDTETPIGIITIWDLVYIYNKL
jgi:predicted transcriptional regulator